MAIRASKMMITAVAIVLLICVVVGAWVVKQQLPPTWQLKIGLQMAGGEFKGTPKEAVLPYRLYSPKNHNAGQPKPLILVLQSSYGRGNNNFAQMSGSVATFISKPFQNIEPAFVLAPQCPIGIEWNDIPPSHAPYVNYNMSELPQSWRQTLIVELIESLVVTNNIDPSRIYITGISMGGTGTWEMLYRFPQFFAAAVPLNGRTDPSVAHIIAPTPIWSFHGVDDKVAPIQNSIEMNNALKKVGSSALLTKVDGGHGIAEKSYTLDLYRWLIQQRLK